MLQQYATLSNSQCSSSFRVWNNKLTVEIHGLRITLPQGFSDLRVLTRFFIASVGLFSKWQRGFMLSSMHFMYSLTLTAYYDH